jgi:predicted membrane channel-forming protein YqfA (hemolysin III family)
MISTRESVRVSSLTVGLAATIGLWTFAAAFAPEILEKFSDYSPWFYGPVWTAAWALFSGVAYTVLRRSHSQNAEGDSLANYRCPEMTATFAPGVSVCASREEKRRLEAATAGFALTISSWVAVLSFTPEAWLDSLNAAPAWFHCLVSVGLWATFSAVIYVALAASERRPPRLRSTESGT